MKSLRTAAVICGLFLVGCDTSESGSEFRTKPIIVPVAINPSNAPHISSAIMDVTRNLVHLSDVAGPALLAVRLAHSQESTPEQPRYAESVAGRNLRCQASGHVSVVTNQRHPNSLSAQDSFTTSFEDCVQDGAMLNGKVDFTVSAVSESAQDTAFKPGIAGASVVLTNFVRSYGVDEVRANGEFNVVLDSWASASGSTVSGSLFSTQDSDDTRTLSDFSVTSTNARDGTRESYSLATAGTVDSAELDGFVSFHTEEVLQGSGTHFPNAGAVKATGEGGSSVTLVALSDIVVHLRVDTDGDGAIDETIVTTWQALFSKRGVGVDTSGRKQPDGFR